MRLSHPCSWGLHTSSLWAWRAVPVVCLYRLTIRVSLAACNLAVGRYTLAGGRHLLWNIAMSTIMAASRESPWGRSCLKMAVPMSCRLWGGHGRAMEVDVSEHGLKHPREQDFGAQWRALPPSASGLSVSHTETTCRATASTVAERSSCGSTVARAILVGPGHPLAASRGSTSAVLGEPLESGGQLHAPR